MSKEWESVLSLLAHRKKNTEQKKKGFLLWFITVYQEYISMYSVLQKKAFILYFKHLD